MDLGFTKDQIEIHVGEGSVIGGYDSTDKNRRANVIVRRKHLSNAYNDIGFKMKKDGTYEIFISDMGMHNNSAKKNKLTEKMTGFNQQWLDALAQRHSANVIKHKAEELGFSFQESYVDGKLVVVCDKSY